MPRTKSPPGPIVCKPLGTFPLRDIDGFPAAAVEPLAAVGCVTLADLEKRVAKQSKANSPEARLYGAIRSAPGVTPELAIPASDAVERHLNVGAQVTAAVKVEPRCKWCDKPSDRICDKVVGRENHPVLGHVRSKAVTCAAPMCAAHATQLDLGPNRCAAFHCPEHAARVMPKNEPAPVAPPPAPVSPPDDFDESTPPPRVRPKGEPLPRCLTVPPGAMPDLFGEWDRAGRVPAGSVLVRYVGTFGSPSGYRDVAGGPVPLEVVQKSRSVATVQETGRLTAWVVLAPAEARA